MKKSLPFILLIALSTSPLFAAGECDTMVRTVKSIERTCKADNTECHYVPQYNCSDTTTFYPLIDKLKPTVKIEAKIGGDTAVLLDQENNQENRSESFLAGNGQLIFTLLDTNNSGFRDNTNVPNWQKYAGISGIRGYDIVISQTHDYRGLPLSTPKVVKSFSENYPANSYNPLGVVTTPHTIIIPVDVSGVGAGTFTTAGKYAISLTVRDEAGVENTITGIPFTIIPKNIDPNHPRDTTSGNPTNPTSITLTKLDPSAPGTPDSSITQDKILYKVDGGGSSSAHSAGSSLAESAYANAQDTNLYVIHLVDEYGNPVYNWKLYDFSLSTFGIRVDAFDPSSASALYVDVGNGYRNTPQTATTDQNGNLFFRIKSYAPGQYTEQFTYTYKLWDRNRNEVGATYPEKYPPNTLTQTGQFYHIFTGAIELPTTNRIDLGTKNDVQLGIFATTSTPNSQIKGLKSNNFMESLVSLAPQDFLLTQIGTYIRDINFLSNYPNPSHISGSKSTFTAEQIGKLFTSTLKVKSWPWVEVFYDIDQITVRYPITPSKNNYGSGIEFGIGVLNRIFIEGYDGSEGNDGYVDTIRAISSVNSADIRNAVHKNAAILIRNRTDAKTAADYAGGIVGRVKYIAGNISTSQLVQDITLWDTVIIVGGNLTIDSDINRPATDLTNIPQKGIIVLSNEKEQGGDIFIRPNVSFIGTILFADESVYSTNANDGIYATSDSARSKDLENQIVFYGGIFSKNTVGGAVRADKNGRYLLPWKGATTDLSEAVQYDLAFLRMDNKRLLPAGLRKSHDEFVVIFTDSRNMMTPLPGFGPSK